VLEELQRSCDVLLVDTPGVIERSEGAWLSARADAVLLVIDARHASKRTMEPVLEVLRDAGATLLGVVLNRVPSEPEARGGVFEVMSRAEGRAAPAPAAPATTVTTTTTATPPARASRRRASPG